jgi:hypothetical protein
MEIDNNNEGIEVQIPVRSASENTVPPAGEPPHRILGPAHQNNEKSAGSPATIHNYCRV